MPTIKENIQNADAGTDPDLTFEYNDILTELRAEYCGEEREPGDISAREVAKELGITHRRAHYILNRKYELGLLERKRVKGSNYWYFVYSKPKQ